MIELHQFPQAWGINPSPFCLKIEIFFRLAGLDYQPRTTLPFLAPRGKLPFITDGDARIADSALIIEHCRTAHGVDLDAGLDARQRALGHLMRRTLEESLYFVLLHARWIDAAGWAAVRPAFFGGMPPGMRQALPSLIRRGIGKTLRAQGYGRHGADGIHTLGIADLDALAGAMTPDGFAVGERATTVDATLYAFLESILIPPIDNPLKRHAERVTVFAAYRERMRARLGD